MDIKFASYFCTTFKTNVDVVAVYKDTVTVAGTRSWAEAETKRREVEDQLAGRVAVTDTARSIRDCVEVFLQDKRVQGISKDAMDKYTRETARLAAYAERAGTWNVEGLTRELLTGYCATWADAYPSTQTRSIVRARLRNFLRYCFEAQWLPRIPAVPKVKVAEEPTMPLTSEEFARLLAAVDAIPNPARRARGRGLVLLMRYSGLAIGDALKLRRKSIQHDKARGIYRVVTSRQKTGVSVSVPIPPKIAEEILAVPNDKWEVGRNHQVCEGHPDYVFWDGKSSVITRVFVRTVMQPAFAASGIEERGRMKSHRLRDTFAVDLLEKGVPLEEVSKLLGHESIKTTERSYAKWVKGRQDRLDDLVTGTWV